MGFDYVPGDMIAALTADGLEPLDEVLLAYSVRWPSAPSRGTASSAIGMLAGGDVEWRGGGSLVAGLARSAGPSTTSTSPPVGRQRMARYPAGEQITVPRHVETATCARC